MAKQDGDEDHRKLVGRLIRSYREDKTHGGGKLSPDALLHLMSVHEGVKDDRKQEYKRDPGLVSDYEEGKRSVSREFLEDFCTAPGRNVLESGEFVVSLHFPAPAEGSGARFLRFIPRNEMDIAVANAATQVRLDGDGAVTWARVAVGAIAPTPLLVSDAAAAIVGRPLSEETIAAAAAASSAAANPITDMRGSIRQRVHLAGVLTERTIRQAAERAA